LHGEKENKVFYQKVRSRLFKEVPKLKGTKGTRQAKLRFAAAALSRRGEGVTSAFRKLWDVVMRGHLQNGNPVAATDARVVFTGKLTECGYSPCMSIKAFRRLLQQLNLELRNYQIRDLIDAYVKTAHPETYIQCDLFVQEALAWQKTQATRPMTPQRPRTGKLDQLSAAQRTERRTYSRGGRKPTVSGVKFYKHDAGTPSRPCSGRKEFPEISGDNFLLSPVRYRQPVRVS